MNCADLFERMIVFAKENRLKPNTLYYFVVEENAQTAYRHTAADRDDGPRGAKSLLQGAGRRVRYDVFHTREVHLYLASRFRDLSCRRVVSATSGGRGGCKEKGLY